MITEIIGYLGLAISFLVAPPQIYKIIKTKNVEGISIRTYQILIICMSCYLIHAISIGATVFILSNSINLLMNIFVLLLLKKYMGSLNGRNKT